MKDGYFFINPFSIARFIICSMALDTDIPSFFAISIMVCLVSLATLIPIVIRWLLFLNSDDDFLLSSLISEHTPFNRFLETYFGILHIFI